jgi:hypothetical protein
MEIVASVPVPFNRLESSEALSEAVRERIARLAYEKCVARGFIEGYELDDWLSAERELILIPEVQSRYTVEDLFIDITIPASTALQVYLHGSSTQIIISSLLDKFGRQIFKVVDLPIAISLDGIDAERLNNRITIVAALAECETLDRVSA